MIFEHDQKLSDALARYEAAHAQPLSEWERRLVRAVREWDVARRAGEAGEKQAGAEPSGDGLPAAGERMEQAYDSGGPGGPAQRPEGVRSSPAPPAEPAPPTATPTKCGRMVVVEVHVGTSMPCVRDRGHDGLCDWMSIKPAAPPTAAPADDDLHFAPCRCDKCREILLGEKPKTPRVSPEPWRVSDADVARIVARTPVEFECDATAYENLALDLRDARAQLAEAQRAETENRFLRAANERHVALTEDAERRAEGWQKNAITFRGRFEEMEQRAEAAERLVVALRDERGEYMDRANVAVGLAEREAQALRDRMLCIADELPDDSSIGAELRRSVERAASEARK